MAQACRLLFLFSLLSSVVLCEWSLPGFGSVSNLGKNNATMEFVSYSLPKLPYDYNVSTYLSKGYAIGAMLSFYYILVPFAIPQILSG